LLVNPARSAHFHPIGTKGQIMDELLLRMWVDRSDRRQAEQETARATGTASTAADAPRPEEKRPASADGHRSIASRYWLPVRFR
jgi:hypothetical protein